MQTLKTLAAFGTTRTVIEWSALYGIKPSTLTSRISEGWPIPRALRTPTRIQRDRRKKWQVFGETHTLRQWSEQFGINHATLYSRVCERGMTIEAALMCEKYPWQNAQPRKNYCLNGHPLSGPNADIYDGTEGPHCWPCIRKRYEDRLTEDLPASMRGSRIALARLRHTMRNCRWDAFGRTMTLTQWAREFNINQMTLRERVYRSGLDLEVALTKEKYSVSTTPTWDAFGKTMTLLQWSREFGIGRGTLVSRLKIGLPLEVALTKEKYQRLSRPPPE